MSLDKQIKEMAAAQLDDIVDAGAKALDKVVKGTPLNTDQLARIVSGHKTKSAYDGAVKLISAQISKDMMASLATGEDKK